METQLQNQVFTNQLLKWYASEKRELPWRNTKDPYKIWLSEIILQQTRIQQGLPYYERFLKAFHNVQTLAKAEEAEVLRLWQGLGYYSRARNLHHCAQQIVNDYGGVFPPNYTELLKLKGVGKYTAAAISSFAYDQAHAVVDGNVFRVLSRFFGISDDISDSKAFKVFEEKANQLIPVEDAANFNQAIMDFGAIQCKPKNPHCAPCPFSSTCFAFNQNLIDQLPVKTKKVKIKKRHFDYFVIRFQGEYLMKERKEKDIWQGLYDFGMIEGEEARELSQVMEDLSSYDLTVGHAHGPVKHVLTHQHIFARFIALKAQDFDTFDSLKKEFNCESFSAEQIDTLPKPILIEKYLKETVFSVD